MSDSIREMTEKVISFRDERNWKQFHNPKDLAISISLEASELLEVFQWSGSNTGIDSEKQINKVREELADIIIYSLLMANDLNLDINTIVDEKITENCRKYPISKAFGKPDKYTNYIEKEGLEK